jgi:vacuolar-type H+-ATPase subunit H
LPPLLRRSGVPALESLIDEYIDKYSFPYRVSRAYAALREAIRKASDKANLEKQLDQDRTELEKIRGAVLDLKARKEKGFDTKAYRDRLKRESKDLPDATRERLLALQQERVPVLRELKNESHGKAEVSPSDAEKFLREAEEQLRFLHLKLLNAYENEFKRAQEEIQADLRKEYKEYVQSLFPESIELKLPVLEGIKNTLSNLSLDLVVRENDIKHIYRTGIYFAGDLYKPWTWLDWRTHTIEDGSKKFVNLGDLWTERENEVERCFQDLVANAQDHIESGHEQLIKEYLAFMAGEFDKHFDNLMADLEAKLSDQKLREVAIANAEKQLGRISSLETELDVVLKV